MQSIWLMFFCITILLLKLLFLCEAGSWNIFVVSFALMFTIDICRIFGHKSIQTALTLLLLSSMNGCKFELIFTVATLEILEIRCTTV